MDLLIANKKELASYAKKTVEEHFSLNVSSVKYIGGGSFGKVFKLKLDCEPYTVIYKFCKKEGMARSETYALKFFSENTSIRFPKVFFVRAQEGNYPEGYCMEYIQGKPAFMNFDMLAWPLRKKYDFSYQVTDMLYAMHHNTAEKFGPLENPTYDKWLDYYYPWAKDIYEKAAKICTKANGKRYIFDAMQAAFDRFDEIFSEEVTTPSAIHGDLNLLNIMVGRKGNITGFIDPLNSMYADREYDLFQLNNLTGPVFGLYELYKQKFEVSEKCDVKTAFYGLWNEVYCLISAGTFYKFIMNPLVKNMYIQLIKLDQKKQSLIR